MNMHVESYWPSRFVAVSAAVTSAYVVFIGGFQLGRASAEGRSETFDDHGIQERRRSDRRTAKIDACEAQATRQLGGRCPGDVACASGSLLAFPPPRIEVAADRPPFLAGADDLPLAR